jgi:hypothetical protein
MTQPAPPDQLRGVFKFVFVCGAIILGAWMLTPLVQWVWEAVP